MAGKLTPMMRQYLELKEKYKDCILLFRLGDFYEMFFDDAKTASRELEIALTGRDCGLEERAPMCGVPYHSVDGYINRLIQKGYKAAICEQITDPSAGKGIVERDVVRVITPGTVIEETMLEASSNNYIASVCLHGDSIGIAYCDVSTGAFITGEMKVLDARVTLFDELSRIEPIEVVANDALLSNQFLKKRLSSQYYLQNYGDWAFESVGAKNRLLSHFAVASLTVYDIAENSASLSAAGALLAYLQDTQKNALGHISSLKKLNRGRFMALDAPTMRNLELTEPLRMGGSKKHTLLNLLNRTKTAMGGRMLKAWVKEPLVKKDEIENRHEAVELLYKDALKRGEIREYLNGIYDIERLSSRIAYGTVHARDCAALRATLILVSPIKALVTELKAPAFFHIAKELDEMEDIRSLLEESIGDEPPLSVKEGGFIRDGYNQEVDELRDALKNSNHYLQRMEESERESTGIKNLKIKYNRVFGYFIEVTNSYQHLVPYTYERKQTLANAERYITPELKKLEEVLLGAEEKLVALEYELFTKIRERLGASTQRLQKNSMLLSMLDCFASLSECAAAQGYVRPEMTEDGSISIEGGRHPVVERSMKDGFIENDTFLDDEEQRLLILTGPNMAGKSTYMRQVALITLMAHMGSFVPARRARISVTDRIFTRVGASDDLAAGQSTFMVEMSEMANILHNATDRSLLILDEIGRGTSTFDGLSIAWAVLEYIAAKNTCGAKALFATHYHELTELEGKLSGVINYRISVKEVGEDIIFLRKIMRGGADKSFGVQVARLAGLPPTVIARAGEILCKLESADVNRPKADLSQNAQSQTTVKDARMEIFDEIMNIDVDALTPIAALNALNELKQKARLC